MTILAPTDFSDESRDALRMAAHLACQCETDLIALHCLESAVEDTAWRHLLEVPEHMRAQFWRAARTRLRSFVQETLPSDLHPEAIKYRVDLDYAEEAIQSEIEACDCDLVVMATTGKGRITGAILRSTTERTVRASPVPVMVVPPETDYGPFRRILAPIDLTPCSRRSLERAVEIARAQSAKLEIIHAYTLPAPGTVFFPSYLSAETIETYETRAYISLETFLETIEWHDVDYTLELQVGAPYRTILERAEEGRHDLIVMGTHGRRGLERLFLGSTAHKVLQQPPCPVMTLRASDDSD